MERKISVRRRRFNRPWTERCKDYVRNFLAFMFSNVGIVGLVVGYTVAGAFIFIEIEGQEEVLLKKNVTDERNKEADAIWKIALKYNTFDEDADKWRTSISLELLKYQKFIVGKVRKGYDGSDSVDEIQSWSFPGAFLYSLTVITTIGYGNIVPRTNLGKVTTIIYAIIGMPLFLLYLSNIGDIMARSFKWLYAKLCLCRCCPGVARRREERERRRIVELTVKYMENREGSGSPEVCIEQGGGGGGDVSDLMAAAKNHKEEEGDDDDDDDDDESGTAASEDTQNVTVPVTVCLAIMVGYILGGTFLFVKYEKQWSILEGSYFCFISLSTIGFGDFVPGKSYYSKSFQLSSIFGSMYLMVGMALIAMCFNLMQEEVINKIRIMSKTIKRIFQCNR